MLLLLLLLLQEGVEGHDCPFAQQGCSCVLDGLLLGAWRHLGGGKLVRWWRLASRVGASKRLLVLLLRWVHWSIKVLLLLVLLLGGCREQEVRETWWGRSGWREGTLAVGDEVLHGLAVYISEIFVDQIELLEDAID